MNALVSGRSGRALILDGKSMRSFDLDDPNHLVPRHPSELPYLFGEAQDLRILEGTTLESVKQELKQECHFTWALDLTLISLDLELEEDIRKEALEGLEELFADRTIIKRVEDVLYSEPLPDDADLISALKLCDPKLTVVHTFLQRLAKHQENIMIVAEAWKEIPIDEFPSFENKQQFRHVAVKEGLFRTLAKLNSLRPVLTLMAKAELRPSIQQLPNYRQVLQSLALRWYDLHSGPLQLPPLNTVSLDAPHNDDEEWLMQVQLIDPQRDPQLNAEMNEQNALYLRELETARADFNERENQMLDLYLEGCSIEEIANARGEDVRSIRIQLRTLILRIRNRVEQKKRKLPRFRNRA